MKERLEKRMKEINLNKKNYDNVEQQHGEHE